MAGRFIAVYKVMLIYLGQGHAAWLQRLFCHTAIKSTLAHAYYTCNFMACHLNKVGHSPTSRCTGRRGPIGRARVSPAEDRGVHRHVCAHKILTYQAEPNQ